MKLSKLLLLLLIAGCTKDVDDSLFKGDSRPVVNCYFNPDSTWKVELWNSGPLVNSGDFVPITDANVEIMGTNGESLLLSYVGDGIYKTQSKPLPKTEYTIKVGAPGYGAVLATDSIPGNFPAITCSFSEVQELFIPKNDVMGAYDVNRISMSIDLCDNTYYYLRAYVYEPKFTNITLTDSSIYKLKDDGLPDFLFDSVYRIKDIIFDNIDDFESAIIKIWGRSSYKIAYGHLLMKHAEKDTLPFNRIYLKGENLYTNDPYFQNLSDDAYLVLGEVEDLEDERFNLDLFVYSGFNNGTSGTMINGIEIREKRLVELYIDFRVINEAMYEYLRTFNLQVVNRTNPFAESVSVYSNIENGLGIFAGYQGKLLRVY